MQQIYEKSTPQTLTIFSSSDSSKKWTNIPKFMLTANFQHHTKNFGMFQLERSWLNFNSVFRELVGEIINFNKKLMQIKNTIEIPNYLKTYHLYKNLHEQLHNLNSIASSIKQAKQQLQQIKLHFHKEMTKVRQVKQQKILPGISSLKIEPQQEQNIHTTLKQINTKRQYEVHTLMPRTFYAHCLPYSDRTFQYKNQQELNELSQTVSVFNQSAHYESRILQHQPSVQSLNSKSKSVSKLASTAWTSHVHNYSSFLNKNNKLQEQTTKPFSQVFFTNKKHQQSHMHSRSVTSFNSVPKIQTRFNKHSTKLLDNMVTKDKIQKIICQPDIKIIKNISQNDTAKPYQIHNTKSSRISFITKPQKSHFINRKQFLQVKNELNKFRKTQSQLKTNMNRKLQFRKYMSNHALQLNSQVLKNLKYHSLKQQLGKRILSLPQKLLAHQYKQATHNDNSDKNRNQPQSIYASKLKIIPEDNTIDPVEQKKKIFQQNLRKQSVKSSLSSYMKYINHLQQPNPQQQQQKSQFNITGSSNLGAPRKSFINQTQQKSHSLTSFKYFSLQKNLGPSKQSTILNALKSHSILKNNQQIIDQVVRIKLKMSQYNTNNTSSVINNKLLFKGLQLHHAPQDMQYQVIKPKLFSNPFFVAPKPSKKSKKSKK